MTTGEKIQNLRQQKGWSQERLGQELNLSRQSVSKWESGAATPTVDNLKEIAKIFDVSVDSLLGNEMLISEKENKKQKFMKILPFVSLGVIAIVLIGLIISQINLYKQLERLENSIAVIPNTVYVPSGGGETYTTLFTSYDVVPQKYYEDRTMDILVSVVLKSDTEGTKVEFSADGQKTVTAEKQGQSYNGVINIPWGAEPKINVAIIKPDGTTENEILPTYGMTSEGLFSVTLMTSYESRWSNRIYADLSFDTTYAPEYRDDDTTMSVISGKPTLIEWEVKEDGQVTEKGSEQIDNDEDWTYQNLSIISKSQPVKVKNMKDVVLTVNITDENGIVTTLSEDFK